MFSLLNKSGELGIRFSKEIQEEYIEKFNTSVLKSHGANMKGYVLIPNKLLSDHKTLIQLLNESYDYVMTLKPK